MKVSSRESFYGYVRGLTIADCISGLFQEPELQSAIDIVDGTSMTSAHQLETQGNIAGLLAKLK